MKVIKSIFILMLMTTIVNLYPYTQKQFEENIDNEYRNIYELANKCDCMDFKTGQKQLEAIRLMCINGIMADAEENGDSSWPKKEIWNEHLLEKKDAGRTLKEIAFSNTPLCKNVHYTLDQIKKSLY